MIFGVLIGQFLPAVPTFLSHLEIANVSVPVAILIWLMIYPMMMKVDFQSVKEVGANPRPVSNMGGQLAGEALAYVGYK